MPTVTFFPEGKKAVVRRGETILQAAAKARVLIPHKCGGNASCTTCKVLLLNPEAFTTPNLREKRKLDPETLKENIRLACQVLVLGNGRVEIRGKGTGR